MFFRNDCGPGRLALRLAANIAKLPDLLIDKPGVVEQDAAND
jgi:hypothetical protein